MKALDVMAVVENERKLVLDHPLSLPKKSRLKVRLFMPEEYADIDEKEWLHASTQSPSFDFLKDPAEDLYTAEDGRPFHD